MRNRSRQKMLLMVSTALLLFTTAFPMLSRYSYAAIPKLETIRVTLFIDSRGTVPTATLSSVSGLNIGVRQPDGIKNWIAANGSTQARASIDQFMVLVLETNDYNAAASLYSRLAEAKLQPYLFSASRKGKPIYQVYTGQFSSMEEAAGAKDKLAASSLISPLLNGAVPSVTGPLHWGAGTYAAEADALRQLALLSQSGLNAHLVYHENAQGGLVYSVWLGEAADRTQLDTLKGQALKLLPNLILQPVDGNQPYLLLRDDISLSKSGTDKQAHYFFNGNGQKVWVTSSQTGIKVGERYERTYRGSLELSRFNGKLAVINELPFEQYLYSVVSSELDPSWPLEALKAQAVAARTYALKMGMKYQIAHISDTTYDQAYKGMDKEFKNATAAVDATSGEVIVNKDGLITPFYYANSGGMTSDPLEIWGKSIDYIKSVPSPDEDAQNGKLIWHRIVLADGQIGYIRSDFVNETGDHNTSGFPYMEAVGSGVNVRPAPYVENGANVPVAQVNTGDRFISFEQSIESNSFNWIRGPYEAQELLKAMNNKLATPIAGQLETLEVTKRGSSGRVIGMKANGQELIVSTADDYRTVLNSLPSTRFDIEEMGKYTILGSNGASRQLPQSAGPLYILGGDSADHRSQTEELLSSEMFFLNGSKQTRLASQEPKFRFIGLGAGHGIGMSQWGARVWSELGYDYEKILKYYYNEVSIVKE